MQAKTLIRRDPPRATPAQDEALAVYRRHAMRALSEERWTAASIFLDRMLEVDPHNTEVWLMKGHVEQFCRENLEAALACYRKVITLCGWDLSHPHAAKARRAADRVLLHWS
jgi:Tfp pilus assembly protein PilF